MNYETVFNIFVGILSLIGGLLIIVFWIVFREENTIHPIYRMVARHDDGDSDRSILTTASSVWNQSSTAPSRTTFVHRSADITPLTQREQI
jgi:hypothetical protein